MPSSPFLHFPLYSAKIPLRWLLIIPFVLQTVGAVALVGYLSYCSGQQAVKNLANQLLRQTSERVSDRLTSYLQPSQQVVASNYFMVQQGILNLNNREQLRQQLWQQINSNPSIPTNGFWSDRGNALIYVRISTEQEKILAEKITGKATPIGIIYFNEISSKQRRYYLVDSQGNPKKLNYTFNDDFRKLAWYCQAKLKSHEHWTPVFVGRISATLETMKVAPVYNAAGTFQGFFTANYFLFNFSTFLNKLNFSPTGQVFIVERSGNLVATSVLSEGSATQIVNGKVERLPAVKSQDELTRNVAQQLLQKFGSFHQIKNAQQLNFITNQQRNFVQVTPFTDEYGLDWLVVTVIPESDFMAQIHNNSHTTFLLCLVTLGLAIASGLVIAHRFTTRITRLNQISQQLASGNLTQRLPANSSIIEVLGLAQSFNLMADQLEKSFDRLHNNLEKSEEKFTTVFRTSPQPAWIATLAEGRCIDVNESFSKVLGYSPTEAIGKSCVEMQLWTDLADLQYFRASLLQYGKIDNFEVKFRTKSAEIKTVLLFAKVTRLDEQDCVIGVLNDISDRKQAEIALQASETRFRTVVEYAPDVLVIYDRDRRLQYVNEHALKRTGWSYETFIGKRDEDLFPPEVTCTYLPILLKTVETRSFGSGEATIQLPGQEPYTILVKYVPILDEQGEIGQIFGITIDITERKQAEIALQTSETRLRLALKASGAIAWERDLETDEILFTNTVTPYIPENIPYQQAMALVHPDDRVALARANQEAIAQRGTFQIEHRVATSLQNPEWRWFQVSARVLTDSTGKPTRIIGMSVDITDRRQLDAMKDEFVSIVSHELRTPLTSLSGSLGILKTGILKNKPDKVQQMLEIAVNNTDRLVRLVNDILNLQRLDSGKNPLVKEICQVNDLIEQAVESVRAIADLANITLEWVPIAVTVSASSDEIVQTLINLLGNAIKFSPPNSTISVKAEVTNHLDLRILAKFPDLKHPILTNCILFSITDRGRGIPADKLESIFGRFQQVDTSDSRIKGGTGLGLAICKNIVQRHQGLIWAESVIGQGSTFYFTLPIKD